MLFRSLSRIDGSIGYCSKLFAKQQYATDTSKTSDSPGLEARVVTLTLEPVGDVIVRREVGFGAMHRVVAQALVHGIVGSSWPLHLGPVITASVRELCPVWHVLGSNWSDGAGS